MISIFFSLFGIISIIIIYLFLFPFHFCWYHFLNLQNVTDPRLYKLCIEDGITKKLKGVGPVVAENIKAYLSASGNFLGPEDLAQVRNLKLNKEEIERINFNSNPKYSFLHTTKSQSDGSTSVGDVSGNSGILPHLRFMRLRMRRSLMIRGLGRVRHNTAILNQKGPVLRKL